MFSIYGLQKPSLQVLKSGGTHSKLFLQEDFLWSDKYSSLSLRLSLINKLILLEKSCFNGSDFSVEVECLSDAAGQIISFDFNKH